MVGNLVVSLPSKHSLHHMVPKLVQIGGFQGICMFGNLTQFIYYMVPSVKGIAFYLGRLTKDSIKVNNL